MSCMSTKTGCKRITDAHLGLVQQLVLAHLTMLSPLCSHINQKTQFENPVMEAKRKMSVDMPAAAPPPAAAPAGKLQTCSPQFTSERVRWFRLILAEHHLHAEAERCGAGMINIYSFFSLSGTSSGFCLSQRCSVHIKGRRLDWRPGSFPLVGHQGSRQEVRSFALNCILESKREKEREGALSITWWVHIFSLWLLKKALKKFIFSYVYYECILTDFKPC